MFVTVVSTLPARAAGILRLDRAVVCTIDQVPEARYQAVTIVVLAGLANGIAIAINQGSGTGLILALLGNVLAWVMFAGMVYVIGTGILAGDATEAEATGSGVFQTIGFAQTPNILAIAGFLGLIGQILALAGLIWMFVCGVVATSISLRVSTGRALIIAFIAGIIALIVLSIVGSLLDQPLM